MHPNRRVSFQPRSPATPVLPNRFHEFYQDWLHTHGLIHSEAGTLRQFVDDFPGLFGILDDLTVHGYRRWLARVGESDSVSAFVDYCAARYRRWRLKRSLTSGAERSAATGLHTAPV
jgi:hypothetical protein